MNMRRIATMTTAHATYGVGLRAAMRFGGAFAKGAALRDTIIILKLPPQADEIGYEIAAKLVVKNTTRLEGFLVLRADVTRKGLLDTERLDVALDLGGPLIVLWPFALRIPAYLVPRIELLRCARSGHSISLPL
ncbi:hypothetical protein ACC807_26215 [Rhizobium ruizarguesonis]